MQDGRYLIIEIIKIEQWKHIKKLFYVQKDGHQEKNLFLRSSKCTWFGHHLASFTICVVLDFLSSDTRTCNYFSVWLAGCRSFAVVFFFNKHQNILFLLSYSFTQLPLKSLWVQKSLKGCTYKVYNAASSEATEIQRYAHGQKVCL